MSALETAVAYHENARVRVSLHRLRELLGVLFPEPPSPDLFTLQDFLNRYRLTGLGKLAVADISRSQRIVRAIGDHRQIGLCEFHIGLIYLYWGQFHGAWQQFAQARRQWSFIHFPAGIVLTQLASGYASMHQHKYEQAMVHLGKTVQELPRVPLSPPSARYEQFMLHTEEYVQQAQAAVRAAMLAPAEDEQDVAAGDANADPDPASAAGAADPLAPPTNNMAADEPHVPVPGHLLADSEHYSWYKVLHRHAAGFMNAYGEGDWLLVYTGEEKELLQTENQPVLILTDPGMEGVIQLVPRQSAAAGGRRIYLAQLREPVPSFERDTVTGAVRLSADLQQVSIDLSRILGIVVGLWRPVRHGHLPAS